MVVDPGNFVVQQVYGGLTLPTAVRFADNGRVFVAERDGRIKTYDSVNDMSPTVVVDLRPQVSVMWDRGMLGLAVDPDFTNGRPYLYVLYSLDAPPGGTAPTWLDSCALEGFGNNGVCGITTGRLDRIEVGPGNVAVSRTTLITDWCQQFGSHSVGDLGFGPEGALYASGGEGAHFYGPDWGQFGANPCDDPPMEGGMLRAQDARTTADPTSLSGTIIRIDPDTGEAWPTNPWAGDPDPNRARIVAYGFRNPYRFTFDPMLNQLIGSDVGWSEFEELNVVELDEPASPNFGWPCYEGPGRQALVDAEDLPLCESLTDTDVRPPALAYAHQSPLAPQCVSGGTSITGVAVARGNTTYPMPFNRGLFMADYSKGCIFFFPRSADQSYDFDNPEVFATGAAAVDLQIGPDGYLYYADINSGRIMRILPTGNNHAPVAAMEATPMWGPLPLTVQFDGTSSSDVDPGSILLYRWDLDDDGIFDDGSTSIVSKTFTSAGNHRVRLRVYDSLGAWNVAETIISAGNSPPVPVIDLPDGQPVAVGSLIDFAGHADDAEDGTLPPTSLRWVFTIEHCDGPGSCHAHEIATIEGVDQGQFQMPDHDMPSFLRITLVATDTGGVSASTYVDLEVSP